MLLYHVITWICSRF